MAQKCRFILRRWSLSSGLNSKIFYIACPELFHMIPNDHEERRRKQNLFLHAIYDYAMGALWLGLGIVCLFSKKFNINLDLDPVLLTICAVASTMYGLFRIWRGYKKTN